MHDRDIAKMLLKALKSDEERAKERIEKIITVVIVAVLLFILWMGLSAVFVLLWNFAIVPSFGLPLLNFWPAVGIVMFLFIIRIIFF